MAEEDSCATQLINGEGEFNVAGLETFTRNVKLSELEISYAVVAIIGGQSTGKSTLLNHLFRTNFLEMDESKGRSQTTKGIWIARAVGIAPCTVIMDLEGCDGKERGKKDETAFEKQSALFALAVSDVVLINMWCNDIGRNEAANMPLLKTVFQAMPQLFSPRKTTLLFVIRDKTKTPLEFLEASLREDMQQIWDTVQKPQAFKDTPLSDFFNVEVTALSSYEKEDQFKEQVGQLRQQFVNSIAPGGLAGDRRGVVPASGFSNWAEKIWKDIKENRDLDLPAHRVMLASVRCDEIGGEQLTRLTSDESWLSLEEAVQAGPVPGFVQRLSSILETYLSEYDTMTLYYDENVRKTKRQEFESKTLQLIHPAYVIFLQHLRSETLESFKMSLEQTLHKGEGFASSVGKCTQACMKKFDFSCAGNSGQQTYWYASKVRGELLRDIEAHASAVLSAKLAEIVTGYEKLLDEALIEPVESLFNTIGEDTWASIRYLLKRETDAAVAGFSSAISGFELDRDSMVQNLQNYARSVVEKKSKDEAGKVLIRMKERFSTVFDYDNRSVPRVWTEKEDIRAIREAAWSASLEVLAVMAVIRLDGKSDDVQEILFSSLMDGTATTDLLASSSWEKIPAVATLITPLQCKSLWREFKAETVDAVKQAVSAQEDHMQGFADAHRSSRVLGYIAAAAVGAAAGAAAGAAGAAAAAAAAAPGAAAAVTGAVRFANIGLLKGVLSGVAAGAAIAVKVAVAVKDAVADKLGAPDLENFAMIRRRNRDMLAESD